jgi:hypothetical protein
MAKVKIQGNVSGTGVFTITPPATSTDRTLTLPDSAGTLVNTAPSTSGNVLTSDGTNWTSAAAAGGGKVKQVIFNRYTTAVTITTTSNTAAGDFADTGLTATITPESGSKILVIVDQGLRNSFLYSVQGNGSISNTPTAIKLYRGSTYVSELQGVAEGLGVGEINFGYANAAHAGATNYFKFQLSLHYLDTHGLDGSTSVTYKTTGAPYRPGSSVFQHNSIPSTMTLIEIGA